MKLAEVMKQLASLGAPQILATYRRHGATGEMFGVRWGDLEKLAKQIKTDQALAAALWGTKNLDAQTLATMIADPSAMSAGELSAWLGASSYHAIADAISRLAARTPHARALAESWIVSRHEATARAGWLLVAHIVMKDPALPDTWCKARLSEIKAGIHAAPNRARDAMNGALIAIGARNEHLQPLAIAAARAIGKIDIDYGETACKTPDAEAYILKMVERSAARAKPAEKRPAEKRPAEKKAARKSVPGKAPRA